MKHKQKIEDIRSICEDAANEGMSEYEFTITGLMWYWGLTRSATFRALERMVNQGIFVKHQVAGKHKVVNIYVAQAPMPQQVFEKACEGI